MIHTMLPTQYLRRAGSHESDPHRRLMAAVLQTVVDDWRGGNGRLVASRHSVAAGAYLASTDRVWPFSFENVCEALGLDPGSLRRELGQQPDPAPPTPLPRRP
jgi:hypothetical protein